MLNPPWWPLDRQSRRRSRRYRAFNEIHCWLIPWLRIDYSAAVVFKNEKGRRKCRLHDYLHAWVGTATESFQNGQNLSVPTLVTRNVTFSTLRLCYPRRAEFQRMKLRRRAMKIVSGLSKKSIGATQEFGYFNVLRNARTTKFISLIYNFIYL